MLMQITLNTRSSEVLFLITDALKPLDNATRASKQTEQIKQFRTLYFLLLLFMFIMK